jgi:hypothetical protein
MQAAGHKIAECALHMQDICATVMTCVLLQGLIPANSTLIL